MAEISFVCGMCGCPCNNMGERLPDPIDFDAKNYVFGYCEDCEADERQSKKVQVTHEMAVDAGDLSLEGQWITW